MPTRGLSRAARGSEAQRCFLGKTSQALGLTKEQVSELCKADITANSEGSSKGFKKLTNLPAMTG